jgi:predicted DNA-binding protein
MKTVTVKVPDDWVDSLDNLAENHGTSRAAVLRSAIDDGLRAHKYYPEDFEMNPERYEKPDAVELAKDGSLPR